MWGVRRAGVVDHRGAGLRAPREIRNVGVVKNAVVDQSGVMASAIVPDGRTRDRVARLLLERGAATAAQLGAQLGLSPAAIRKHLDAMLADGLVETREARSKGPRGRGRPAKA